MSKREPPIGITGVWLRRRGDDAEVLVEVDGVWRLVIAEYYDGAFSHITEQSGIRKAPADPLPDADEVPA
jgi:hypothetical protein